MAKLEDFCWYLALTGISACPGRFLWNLYISWLHVDARCSIPCRILDQLFDMEDRQLRSFLFNLSVTSSHARYSTQRAFLLVSLLVLMLAMAILYCLYLKDIKWIRYSETWWIGWYPTSYAVTERLRYIMQSNSHWHLTLLSFHSGHLLIIIFPVLPSLSVCLLNFWSTLASGIVKN